MAVTNKPTHPAKAVGWSIRVYPSGILIINLVKNDSNRGSPRLRAPDGISDIETRDDIASPTINTGIAMTNPQIGPAAPISSNAFLFGIGSLIEMNAPIVPKGRIGFGGIGIKNGREVATPCLFETK